MKKLSSATTTWREVVSSWNEEDAKFQEIRDIVVANAISDLLVICNDNIVNFAMNNRYIAPVRATAERYYRLQDLAVDEVDFQGQNLAMFLRNLTPAESKNFAEWTEENFGFAPEVSPSSGHISLKLREKGSSNIFNLADKGFGFSQILPILTQLWVISYQKRRRSRSMPSRRRSPVTFAIEQPELHLHPYLQAQLIDAFITSIKAAADIDIDLRLVVETHSETIVNRLGHRINTQAISHQDVNVVLFEKKSSEEPTIVRFSKYDEQGFLVNWPFGFFDPGDI